MNAARILVPIDFSDASKAALRLAISVARDSTGSITLLHVGSIPYAFRDLTLASPTGELLVDLSERMSKEQRAALEELAKEEIPEVMEHFVRLREGAPWLEILDEVAAGDHDLVVMGTHGRSGLKRAFLGSVAERVIRDCPVPVLITR